MTVPIKELLRICPNCGERGPHMVPPSMGEPSFFTCKANPQLVAERREALKAKYAAPPPAPKPETRDEGGTP